MSVYVDKIAIYVPTVMVNNRNRMCGQGWCHMYADAKSELIKMAKKIDLKLEWSENVGNKLVYFILTPNSRKAAIRAGAIEDREDENLIRLIKELK